jgi:hypothetical protein
VSTPPSSDWREEIAPDETARFATYAKQLRALQKRRARGGAPLRALHAKGLGVAGELRVRPDLAPELRRGLFAEPATYRCYVRFSNGAGTRQADRTGDVRGVAIKVLGVPGKKLIPGLQDARTQDFLLIGTPSVPFRDPAEFIAVVLGTVNPVLALPRLIGALGVKRTLALAGQLRRSLGRPFFSALTARYFTAVPIQYGELAAKLSLFPGVEPQAGVVGDTDDADYLRRDLAARLGQGAVELDLGVQLFRDAARTPIEDSSIEWPEEVAPRQSVATLRLPAQDLNSPRGLGIAARVEAMSFDPWHAIEAHRPLGGMMRARNPAYKESTEERAAAREPDDGDLD